VKFEPLASQEAEKINRQVAHDGMKLVTDQDYWESMGITTGEELALEILTQTYSDTYKEIHGIRPRRQFDSPEEAQEALEELYDDYDSYDDYDYDLGPDTIDDEEEEHDSDYPDLPSSEGMGRRYTEGIEALREYVRENINEWLLAEDLV
jgi:hypothetical protein